MSNVLASITGKAVLNPLVASILANSHVASFIAHNAESVKAPTGSVNIDASRIVPVEIRVADLSPTYDTMFSLPVAVACTSALLGVLVSVLALKGFGSATTQSFAGSEGDGEEAPEPDSGVGRENNAGLVHDSDNANGGGEEPPQSQDAVTVAKPPHKGSGWLLWILMALAALSYYYWRQFSRFIWRKGAAILNTFLTAEQRRRVYSAAAAVINRTLSSFANPMVLSVISGLVVDYLCGETPVWIPASITAFTAWSAMSALYASTFIARLVLSSSPVIYKSFAHANNETRRLGAFRWLLWPLASIVLACASYNWSALFEMFSRYSALAKQAYDSAVSLGWQDHLPLAQNLVRFLHLPRRLPRLLRSR
ncbi:hypothetical protein B0H16DRAFT_1591741, partial [Mycena metata]